MPKLVNSLEKRFSCPHCKESFRTRQGLSGHIRFKHRFDVARQDKFDNLIEIVEELEKVKAILPENMKPLPDSLLEILPYWEVIKRTLRLTGVELTQQDFKIYVLTKLAQLKL